jgi:hypothetical protein
MLAASAQASLTQVCAWVQGPTVLQCARDNVPQTSRVLTAVPVGALEHWDEGALQGVETDGPLVTSRGPQTVAKQRVACPVRGFLLTIVTDWH